MKCLEFFTNGYTAANSVSEFLNSPVGLYLEKIYGELNYIETIGQPKDMTPINFIEVIKVGSEYYIFDTIYLNNLEPFRENRVGMIFPAKYTNFELWNEGIPGFINPLSMSMAKVGYGTTWRPESEYLDKLLPKQKWAKLPSTVFDSSNNYDVVEEYLSNQSETLPFLYSEQANYKKMIDHSFIENQLILQCLDNTQSRAQRMTHGTSLVRHFDADKDEPYLFSTLTWHIHSKKFSGRELICGRRSQEDLAKFIKLYLEDPYFQAYNYKIEEAEDIVSIRPVSGLNVFVNTANPLFYHAVSEMNGDGEIYTIVHDCRMHND